MQYFGRNPCLINMLQALTTRKPLNKWSLRAGNRGVHHLEAKEEKVLMRHDLLRMHRRRSLRNCAVIDQLVSRSPHEYDPCRGAGADWNPQALRRRQRPR